jgi:hypothetical protein
MSAIHIDGDPHCACDACLGLHRLQAQTNGHNPPLRPRKPAHSRHVRMWSPRSTAPRPFVLTESHIYGLNVHYMDRRTHVCTAGVRYCYPCRVRIPLRWKGYIGAMDGLTRTPVVLEMTAWAWAACPELERADGKLFRRVLKTWRMTNVPQSKQFVELLPETYQGIISYQVRAVEILGRVFEMSPMELGVLAFRSDDPALDSAEGQDVP